MTANEPHTLYYVKLLDRTEKKSYHGEHGNPFLTFKEQGQQILLVQSVQGE